MKDSQSTLCQIIYDIMKIMILVLMRVQCVQICILLKV